MVAPGLGIAGCHHDGHGAGHGQGTPWGSGGWAWPGDTVVAPGHIWGWAWLGDTMGVPGVSMARGHCGGPGAIWGWA